MLISYINGVLQLQIMYKKLIAIEKKIKEINEWKQYDLKLSQDFKLISDIIDKIRANGDNTFEGLNICHYFDELLLSHLDKFEEFYIKDANDAKSKCSFCFLMLDPEPHTNIFGFDFHVPCINSWLNLVDTNSPFILK